MITTHTWLNGTIVENAKATVPFLTSGFHYGIGVFEGIRAYDADKGAAVFRLREHLERFHGSSLILGFLEQPYSIEELTRAVKDTIKANGFGGCYIRPFLWLGDGGWNLTLDTGKPLVGVAVWKQSVYLGQTSPDVGMKLMVSSYTRHHPNAMMTKAKVSGNYVNSFIAKTEAQRNGFDEAVLLDPEGYVAECTGANIFAVRKGRLLTPGKETILEGITRSTVIALAEDMGLEVEETRLSRDQMYLADEVFACGTAAEIVGVATIDKRTIGIGATGPITKNLREAYGNAVRGRHRLSEQWLEYVEAAVTV